MKNEEQMRSLSPREFLKARRPEKFSDSSSVAEKQLDRSKLEYHLESLTSRSQELDFENFGRALAQLEICPNLLPHTGPTGGGDSKVDSESYPVADALSLTWFRGIGREASSERWAFAFSAMKKWQTKVRSDIAKIAATGRNYQKAFFVTNQFVPDRKRAEIEDELTKEYALDVRVLDRTWILDRVFSAKHQNLAIQELRISVPTIAQENIGPGDSRKRIKLDQIEKRIQEAANKNTLGFSLVGDCLDAAIFARSLELPRVEIEGRFLRAQRVADQHGNQIQKLSVAYEWAWTCYWWFEDASSFTEKYSTVEKLAENTRNVYDLERLFNLWCNLISSIRNGTLQSEASHFDQRTEFLTTQLRRLEKDQDRPSSALQAESLHLMVQLFTRHPDQSDPLLKELERIIDNCGKLIGFPFEPLVEIIATGAQILGHRPAFDALQEKLVSAVTEREGELAAARVLMERGSQELEADRPFQAIRFLGQALVRLYKDESRAQLIKALSICGAAYERVGLLWAARGTVLTSASIAGSDFTRFSDVTPHQVLCFYQLKWLELRLGRIPHLLIWHDAAKAVYTVLAQKGYVLPSMSSNEMSFDAGIAILFLKTDLSHLSRISRLPDTLENLELEMSSISLRFALGHEDSVPKELAGQAGSEEMCEFFIKLRDQPIASDLPATPRFYSEQRVTLESRILGCAINVTTDNASPYVELAESILASMESLLSTGMHHDFIAGEPCLTIQIEPSEFAAFPFAFDSRERDGRPLFEIKCPHFAAHKLSPTQQPLVKERLFEFLASVLGRVFVPEFKKDKIQSLLVGEHGLERAIDFTGSFVSLGNVLGEETHQDIQGWINSESRDFPLKRMELWDAKEQHRRSVVKVPESKACNLSKSFDKKNVSHADMKTVSLISERLWNEAEWAGTMFLWSAEGSMLSFVFRNGDSAKEIFRLWKTDLGANDPANRLRLTIIRGIQRKNPHAYRIVVGSNVDAELAPNKSVFFLSRMNTMEPKSSQNLDAFLENYLRTGTYFLGASIFTRDASEPKPLFDCVLQKRDLQVRQAWQISRNDIDLSGIRSYDEPLIPQGQENAPIIEAIAWLKEIERRNQ